MRTLTRNAIAIIAIICILFFSYTEIYKYNDSGSYILEKTKIFKNKNKESVAVSAVIDNLSITDFLKKKTTDEEIKNLQKLVEKYKNGVKSSAIIKIKTVVDTVIKTVVDTIVVNNVSKAVYSSTFDLGGWVAGSTIATDDSTKIYLSIKNDYDMTFVEKNHKTIAYVVSKNPYSDITAVMSYVVPEKKDKRISVTAFIGYDILSNKPALGVGLGYRLLKL